MSVNPVCTLATPISIRSTKILCFKFHQNNAQPSPNRKHETLIHRISNSTPKHSTDQQVTVHQPSTIPLEAQGMNPWNT